MPETASLRAFTADYYRHRGAAVTPLPESDALAVRLPSAERSLVLAFGPAAPEGAVAMHATAAPWRALLDELTEAPAVSYRYLAARPVAQASAHFEARLPEGWTVREARFVGVVTHQALGVTTRASFDAPALSARREALAHHVWDLASRERLPAVEEVLFTAPCLLFRPKAAPAEGDVAALATASLGLLEAETAALAGELEAELTCLFEGVETRTQQYYDQQLGGVIAKEAGLAEKREALIRKLAEAKTPEAIAKIRAEGEAVAAQLAALGTQRDAELATVLAACDARLEAERERHELVMTAEVVALSHVSFDWVDYDLVLADRAGSAHRWRVRTCFATGEIAWPACPECEAPLREPTALATGEAVCAACAKTCEGCGAASARRAVFGACMSCEALLCPQCESACQRCGEGSCPEHAASCVSCGEAVCAGCVGACPACEERSCLDCGTPGSAAGVVHCEAHPPLAAEAEPAAAAACPAPEPPALVAIEPPAFLAPDLAPSAEIPPGPLVAPVLPILAQAALTVPAQGELAAPAALPEAAEVPAVAAAPAESLPDDLASFYSPAERAARVAESCHGCGRTVAPSAIVHCETCLLPACGSCAAEACPACALLASAEREDERLAPVLACLPELGAGRARWEVARYGPYTLAYWRRFGRWGVAAVHGASPPVLIADVRGGLLSGRRG